jgi:hypothetical protein
VNVAGSLQVSGDVTAPNLYDRTTTNALLSNKADAADVYENSELYTRVQTDGLLAAKQASLTTPSTDEVSSFQVLNGTKVKALRAGANVTLSADTDFVTVAAPSNVTSGPLGSASVAGFFSAAYGDPGTALISCVNTDTANGGRAAVQVVGKSASGLLMADSALELRTSDGEVALVPGYVSGEPWSPALRAFGSGDVQVSGALAVQGDVAAPNLYDRTAVDALVAAAAQSNVIDGQDGSASVAGLFEAVYDSAASTQINCVNTNTSGGAAVVQVISTQSSGSLMASDTFQLRTSNNEVALFPDANNAQSAALRAFGSGDVQVSGAVSQGGLAAFKGRKTNGSNYQTAGVIVCNVIPLNTGGAFDGTTFTVPRQGHYMFFASAQSTTQECRWQIEVVGGEVLAARFGDPPALHADSMSVTTLAFLAAGQQVQCRLTTGGIWTGNHDNAWMWGGYWIG